MSETVNKSSDTITGIIFVAILLSIFLLVIVVLFGALQSANISNGADNIYYVNNESGAFINSTPGYTLQALYVYGAKSPTITSVINGTTGFLIQSGNYTLNPTTFVMINNSARLWTGVNISYTYLINSNSANNFTTTTNAVQNGIIGTVVNFFALMPTIGTILAVIILIAGIVILIVYVQKMRIHETTGSFQG